MAQRVAVAVYVSPGRFRFPSAIDRRLWLQPRIDAEIMQHPVGLEPQQIGLRHSLGVEERPLPQGHVRHVEGFEPGRPRHAVRRTRLRREGWLHAAEAGGDRGRTRAAEQPPTRGLDAGQLVGHALLSWPGMGRHAAAEIW